MKSMSNPGVYWAVIVVYAAAFILLPIVIEITLRSKWWRRQSDYYFSFNETKEKK